MKTMIPPSSPRRPCSRQPGSSLKTLSVRSTSRSHGSRRLALGALLALALSSLAWGCKSGGDSQAGASASKEPPKLTRLGFVTNNASEFWKIAQAGVKKYEVEGKVQVDVLFADGTVADQNKKLEELASQHYDAISVSVIAPADQANKLNDIAKESQLITFDSDAPDSKRLLYIGTNNFEAGKALGAKIVELLPDGGKMAVFVGSLSADNAKQRLGGIEESIRGHQIEIVDKREDQNDPAKAQANVEDIINAHSDLDLVAGLWSYNGPAIALAIDRLGKKGSVIGVAFDEEEETLSAIEKGLLSATVVQKPFQIGYLTSKWMHALAVRPEQARSQIPEGGVVDTGVEVITKANVAAFAKRLAELKTGVN